MRSLNSRLTALTRWTLLPALVLAVSGCTTMPHPKPLASRTAKHLVVDDVDVDMVNTVFIRGFGIINDRAYEAPDVNKLFIAGIEGLKTIDPALGFAVVKDKLILSYNDRPIVGLGPASKKDIQVWSITALRAILVARKYSKVMHDASEEKMYRAVFTNALTVVDPYSRYATYADAIKLRLLREGVIGLGIRLEMGDSGPHVQALIDQGPGDLAGLKLNDVIVSANGVSLSGMTLEEVRHRLDGELGAMVSLTVRRAGLPDLLTTTAALDLVVPDTVTSDFVDGVLTVKITSFNQRTAKAVERAVTAAHESGQLKGVVLDLRGDPGGLLDQAIDVADIFLKTGTIATLHGRHPGANQFYAANNEDLSGGAPVAIVIDGKSASAAEIVAAALQDNGRAAVIGTVSWGKGSVQTLQRMPNGGEIAITWARVLAPRGIELHGLGLMPDVCLSGEPASADAAIAGIGSAASVEIRRQWHEAADDSGVHEILRTECAPEPHPDRALDLDVARRIVSDRRLYAETLTDRTSQFALKP